MPPTRPLSAVFLAAAPASDERADLEEVLHAVVDRARAEAPVSVEVERFVTFLATRVAASDLDACRAGDLWLACACTGGDAAAIELVEARHFQEVTAAIGKMGLARDRVEEVKQGLRRLLFVGGADGRPPRIAEYRGTGELRAWLRVTATRAALKLVRADQRDVPTGDDALFDARAPDDDPELAYMKAAYRAAFRAAFQDALETLNPRERLLLKQHVVDGLTIDELGALHQAHRATAARWVAAARDKLLGRTRRTFMLRARITSDECDTIMRLVRSQLDVSIRRRLAAG